MSKPRQTGHGGLRAGAGRKAFEPTDALRAKIEALAGVGLTQEQIALVAEMSEPTLRKYFYRELSSGAAKATANVAQTLYKRALAGNIAAMIFWMKARANWSERVSHEHSGPGGAPIQVEERRAGLADRIARFAAATKADGLPEGDASG